MVKYVAFLRAINVGGTRVIKMENLRRILESFGLDNVQTYIQSGNVIFESEESDASTLERQIERQLEEALGYKVQLFVRTMRETASIAEKPPFNPKADEVLHIVFLREAPKKKPGQDLMSLKSKADDFLIKGREAYNLRRDREKSVFSNQFIEKVLGVSGTTRNLTTIRRIVEKYM